MELAVDELSPESRRELSIAQHLMRCFVIQKIYGKHVNNLFEHILIKDLFQDKAHELT